MRVVREAGLEPATSAFAGLRSNPLSYSRVERFTIPWSPAPAQSGALFFAYLQVARSVRRA
jgi:hypothetical protein